MREMQVQHRPLVRVVLGDLHDPQHVWHQQIAEGLGRLGSPERCEPDRTVVSGKQSAHPAVWLEIQGAWALAEVGMKQLDHPRRLVLAKIVDRQP